MAEILSTLSSAVLSQHTTTGETATGATIGCTTDTAGGTLYWYLSQSNVAPTPAELKAGTNAEQFGNLVPTLGANTVDLTGLTSSTEYWHYWIQETT